MERTSEWVARMKRTYTAERITWREVESSNVRRVGWDRHGSMFVEYHSGGVYEYKGVSRQRAVACAYAKSVGQYVRWRIKPNFPAVSIS